MLQGKINYSKLNSAKKHLEILKNDLQKREDAFDEKISHAHNDIEAEKIKEQKERLRATYESSFSYVQKEIETEQALINHCENAILEENKLAVESQKAKICSALASEQGCTDAEFEKIWPTIRDRILIDYALDNVTRDSEANQQPHKISL
jgi:hypothetical protein